jgi:hypothetical protein
LASRSTPCFGACSGSTQSVARPGRPAKWA